MNPQLACPSRSELTAYLSGEISPSRQEEIGEHLAHCATCLETLDRCNAEDTSRNADTILSLGPADADAAPVLSEPECRRMIAAAQEIHVAPEQNGNQQALVAPRRREQRSLPGALGPYELLGRVGEGGMGAVYKARHKRLERIVALKIIAEHRVADSQSLERFFREWVALAKLQHKNIVQAIDAGDDDDFHYLVMEHVDGIDLARLVRRGGRLKIADACEIIRQAALGLEYVHDQKLVHRDIKPSNLMIDSAGQVKILDLGLAVLQNDDRERSGLTVDQQILGTVDYMAPEQAFDSHRAEIQADIYSLGCTLYFLLTGRAPFSGAEYSGTMKKLLAHSQAQRPSIGAERADVPPKLDALVRRMIAKSPTDRPASPGKVARELERFAAGSDLERLARGESTSNLGDAEPNATPSATGRRNRSRRARIAVVGLIFAAVFGLGFFLVNAKRPIDGTPNALGPLSLSFELRKGGWESVLTKRPTELLFSHAANGASWWNYDQDSGQIHFNSPTRLVLQLGSTSASDYELMATFNQTPWTGNVGLFFGCHAPKSGALRFQSLSIKPAAESNVAAPTGFFVDREIQLVVGNERGTTGGVARDSIKNPLRQELNHTLKIRVRGGKLTEVTFDAERLPKLVKGVGDTAYTQRGGGKIGPEDGVGGFGIYTWDGSATVLDAYFRLVKGENAHGEETRPH